MIDTGDPVLSANIYASGLLDEILFQVIGPLAREVNAGIDATPRASLWVMRNNVRGQHLKVRIHTAASNSEAIRARLDELADQYFSSIRHRPPAHPRSIMTARVTPIDVEDQPGEPFPDRSLLWTTYRRVPVSFAPAPWVSDDDYVDKACVCLSAACECILFQPEIPSSTAARQSLLIRFIASALHALGRANFTLADDYLRYHRDWLLRFFLRDDESLTRVNGQFESQARNVNLPELWKKFEWYCQSSQLPIWASWSASVCDFGQYIASFEGKERFQIDPFTRNTAFPPIFKLLHSVSNQIGFHPLQEAYLYHLLILACSLSVNAPSLGMVALA